MEHKNFNRFKRKTEYYESQDSEISEHVPYKSWTSIEDQAKKAHAFNSKSPVKRSFMTPEELEAYNNKPKKRTY